MKGRVFVLAAAVPLAVSLAIVNPVIAGEDEGRAAKVVGKISSLAGVVTTPMGPHEMSGIRGRDRILFVPNGDGGSNSSVISGQAYILPITGSAVSRFWGGGPPTGLRRGLR